MLNTMNRHRARRAEGDRGFTLIELLVVVVIIGILIAIAVPLYLNYRKGANDKAAQSDLRSAISAFEQCNSDNGTYPTSVTSAGVVAGCTGNTQLNLSSNTTVGYVAASPTVSFKMAASNSGGTKTYCYNSAFGGSIKDLGTTTVTAATASSTTAC